MYSVDFDRLISLNMPVMLDKPVLHDLIAALQSPLVNAHVSFTILKRDTDTRLMHDGRVFSLRKILNDKFDPGLRRIDVVDAIVPDENYIGNKDNQNVTYISTALAQQDIQYIGNAPQYMAAYDFVVTIPIDITDQTAAIKQVVSEYKQAGKTFTINTEE